MVSRLLVNRYAVDGVDAPSKDEADPARIFGVSDDDVDSDDPLHALIDWPKILEPESVLSTLRALDVHSPHPDRHKKPVPKWSVKTPCLCRFLSLIVAKVWEERTARLRSETVETWENERKTPGHGWSKENLLPCDPPRWSEVGGAHRAAIPQALSVTFFPVSARPQPAPPPSFTGGRAQAVGALVRLAAVSQAARASGAMVVDAQEALRRGCRLGVGRQRVEEG